MLVLENKFHDLDNWGTKSGHIFSVHVNCNATLTKNTAANRKLHALQLYTSRQEKQGQVFQ